MKYSVKNVKESSFNYWHDFLCTDKNLTQILTSLDDSVVSSVNVTQYG